MPEISDTHLAMVLHSRLIEDARRAATGLPESANVAALVRYALAVLAGRPDPAAVAVLPRGNPRHREARAERAAREQSRDDNRPPAAGPGSGDRE